MLNWMIYGMVYLGALLMVYNIYGFISYARYVRGLESWREKNAILYVPTVLLIFFLLGYVAVGVFGDPDLIVAGILFGGSIFVFIIYKLLSRITRRVVESERIEARLLAVEESNQTKNRFLAGISHEIRTPMNVIIGLGGIALKNPDLSDETRGQLEKIEQSGQHLMGIINSILDMNRIESGQLSMDSRPFRPSEVAGRVCAVAQALCDDKSLDFDAQIDGSISVCCLGDREMLAQVLMQLLDNAAKFTNSPGRVTFRAGAEPCNGGYTLRFTVSDTGIGMSEEFLQKGFGRFVREDASSTSNHGGVGIGLVIAKEKLSLMGGDWTVESKKGEGTTFTVTVPAKAVPEAARAEEPAAAAPAQQEAGDDSLEGRRILIVEDIPENAEIAADLLELEGAESEWAGNGKIGLEMFAASEPGYYDAILMDLRMPIMDGPESARRIRALDRPDAKTIPIIALTANAFDSDVKLALESGMDAHLSKPADSDLLYETLKKAIFRKEISTSDIAQ